MTRAFRILQIGGAIALALGSAPSALAQLNENCTVSILNRTVLVNPDGTWVLPNVPSNLGQVKARATCVQNGVTTSGESGFFTVPANGTVDVANIVLGVANSIPSSMSILPTNSVLGTLGQTVQLGLTATYPDGTTKNVTASSTGTNYTTSNPAIATVTMDGLLTAVSSGTVVIQVTNDGTPAIATVRVALSNADSDGDGIPDDVEISLGLNPNNAADALEDLDRDGLINRQEIALGTNLSNSDSDGDGLIDGDELSGATNPLLTDTDGDLIPDGIEVQTGSNPLDRNSYDLARALSSFTVTPVIFTLTVNTLVGQASEQLTVLGLLIDGKTTVDLTSTQRRTNYASSDLTICNFGAPDGRVFASTNGTCTISITNSGFTATATAIVSTFTPKQMSFVPIPGAANNVDVNGNFAYVAAGSTGLQIVDITSRTNPIVVSSVDTPGNANDVVVAGSFAYVADGVAGLQIVDISTPLAPSIVGAYDTTGNASDVAVRGAFAYVADGSGGLQIFDVTNPSSPMRMGFLAMPGTASGVDVDSLRQVAAVAAGTSGVHFVRVADPTAPVLLSTVPGGNVRDVVINGSFTFLADFARSLTSVDASNPAVPILLTSTPAQNSGLLQDLAVVGRFAAGADVFFVNGIPIVNVAIPANPAPLTVVNLTGDYDGTGIAMDGKFIYVTAVQNGIGDNFVNGASGLFIAQYLATEDKFGVPPQVSIVSPLTGSTVTERANVPITVVATDDVEVASVTVFADGQPVSSDTAEPYQFNVKVPVGMVSITLVAVATDLAGSTTPSSPVVLSVVPDTNPPAVQITVSGLNIIEGNSLQISVTATDDVGMNRVDVLVNGSLASSFASPPYVLTYAPLAGTHTLLARAIDLAGNSAESTVQVVVVPDTVPPSVSITSPLTGINVLTGSSRSVTVAASDNVRVTRVDLLENGVIASTDSTSPFSFTYLAPTSPQTVTLTAGAIDPAGNSTVSAPVVLNVTVAPPPTVSFSSMPNPVQEGGLYNYFVQANHAVGITKVELLVNNVVTLTDTTASYVFSLPIPLNISSFTIAARATSVDNATTQTATFVITVTPDPAPTISLKNPLNTSVLPSNITVTEGALLEYAVSASDNNSVDQVNVFVNGQRVDRRVKTPAGNLDLSRFVFQAPFGMSSVILRASAVDNLGRESFSSSVNVSIAPDSKTSVAGIVSDATGIALAGATVGVNLKGLSAEVFNFTTQLNQLPALGNLAPTLTKTVSTLNTLNPNAVLGADPWGFGTGTQVARFRADLTVTMPGPYSFKLKVNEGGRLLVNGATVIDLSASTGSLQEGSGTVTLNSSRAAIEVLAFANASPEIQLSYTPPSGQEQSIHPLLLTPASRLGTQTTDSNGAFSIPNVPTAHGYPSVTAEYTPVGGSMLSGTSRSAQPQPTSVTNVGQVRVPQVNGKIAFERPGISPIRIVDADGRNEVGIGVGFSATAPDWAPDGTQIVFADSAGIVKINSDGSNFVRLTNTPGDSDPKWSPDGQWIAFVRKFTAQLFLPDPTTSQLSEIYKIRPDASGLVRLTTWNPSPVCTNFGILVTLLVVLEKPTWSPDSSSILISGDKGFGCFRPPFSFQPNFTGGLFVFPANSSDLDAFALASLPASTSLRGSDWSSTGMIVSVDQPGNPFLRTNIGLPSVSLPVNLSSLSFVPGFSGTPLNDPTWSPDSNEIVFGLFQLLIKVNADGSDLRVVAWTNSPKPNASWRKAP